MTFTEIFNSEDLTNKEKVAEIVTLVAGIRKTYGNTDLEVSPVKVDTADGLTSIAMLSDEDKVAVAQRELRGIAQAAEVTVDEVEGAVIDRSIEAMISTNHVLCNIGAASGSAYL